MTKFCCGCEDNDDGIWIYECATHKIAHQRKKEIEDWYMRVIKKYGL